MEFEELYCRFRGPVWRLARRLTGNDDDALDASQEIFTRVWRGLPAFRGEAKLSTWVFQIAWNHLRGARRARLRQARVEPALLTDAEDPPPDVADSRPDPERLAGSRELLERLEGALATLPEHFRAIVWLRDGEDMSYQEIADVLDVPIGTVRSRLARARDALRRAVEGT